jgi:hypothetical protein
VLVVASLRASATALSALAFRLSSSAAHSRSWASIFASSGSLLLIVNLLRMSTSFPVYVTVLSRGAGGLCRRAPWAKFLAGVSD